jgi:sodium/potassium-transporting ATPase subunit beta
LNRIFGWLPQYTPSLIDNEPEVSSNEKFIYIKCGGEHSADKDNIGSIDYYSTLKDKSVGGLSFKYYPYRNQEDYLSPLVFLHFKSLPNNVAVNVLCRAYAANIQIGNKNDGKGIGFFTLFLTE